MKRMIYKDQQSRHINYFLVSNFALNIMLVRAPMCSDFKYIYEQTINKCMFSDEPPGGTSEPFFMSLESKFSSGKKQNKTISKATFITKNPKQKKQITNERELTLKIKCFFPLQTVVQALLKKVKVCFERKSPLQWLLFA